MSGRRLRRHRYQTIGKVLVRHGFEGILVELGLRDVLGPLKGLKPATDPDLETRPARLRRTLEDLGTTFVKLGQILSTRPDLLPCAYVEELSKLQDGVAPIDYEQVLAVIRAEFGSEPSEVFAEFDPAPRAAASIGQVHNAKLKDGTRVVVKIRRPGIEVQIEEDLVIMSDLAKLAAQNTRLGKLYDLPGWVEEFGMTLRNELDYVREGQNADRIRKSFASDPRVKVPTVFWEYSTSRVLTMEEITGIKISDSAALDDAGIDKAQLAETCAHIAVTQIFQHGFFHADPHPGNFFVLPEGVIGLIDYGMVGRLDKPLRDSLVRLALAATHEDADRFIDEMLDMDMAAGPIDRHSLRRDLRNVQQKFQGHSLGKISIGTVFNDVMGVALNHGLRMPSDLMLLFRVIVMDEGMGSRLDPSFKLAEFATPYLTKFWIQSHSPAAVNRRFKENALDLADVMLDLPQDVRRLLGQIERGEMSYTSKTEISDKSMTMLRQAANRIAVSILASGLIVGLSFLTLAHRIVPQASFSNVVLEALLVVALISGIWLLVSIWRSGR